jgi:hypothetical protein
VWVVGVFAAIDGGLLAWEFELKDAAGNTLALIDRCVCVVVCFWCVGRGERAVGV